MTTTRVAIKDFRTEVPIDYEKTTDDTIYLKQLTFINKNKKYQHWLICVKIIDTKTSQPVAIDDSWFDRGVKIAPNYTGWYKVDKWQEGGVIAKSAPTIVPVGKNLNRKNATNVLQQALSEAASHHNKQLVRISTGIIPEDTGKTDSTDIKKEITLDESTEAPDAKITLYPPMLADSYNKRLASLDKKATYYVQRKYNGLRMIVSWSGDGGRDSKIVAYSRQRKNFNIGHSLDFLLPIFIDYYKKSKGISRIYLDGEVFRENTYLQTISGYIRSGKFAEVGLKLMIFDMFVELEGKLCSATYFERMKRLNDLLGGVESKLVELVETFVCDISEIEDHYEQFLLEGYEGAIVRCDAKYETSENDHHSRYLLKMKPRQDGEYKLVGYKLGENGKTDGAIILICQLSNGDNGKETVFNITPALSIARRLEYADLFSKSGEFDKFKGNFLCIKYDEMSRDGVPLRASTKKSGEFLLFRDMKTDKHYVIDTAGKVSYV